MLNFRYSQLLCLDVLHLLQFKSLTFMLMEDMRVRVKPKSLVGGCSVCSKLLPRIYSSRDLAKGKKKGGFGLGVWSSNFN